MNIDSNSECIRSKYFTGRTAMDESLSDFQEAKQNCKGPKPAQKSKPKAKKAPKRIKGQKDIRTALKGKKNELISYSNDFDTVCKKSGLDVDSEQLQLAIALSKSLQTESSGNPKSSQTLSSQERVSNIRKTLQEYGFKVPDAKINTKKRKTRTKQYLLLTITEEERHQRITGKYSKILFENHTRLGHNNSNNQDSDTRIFNVAANITYEEIKDNRIFYMENFIEISLSSGCLLRDWSEIPGRPSSPTLFEGSTINFKDIDCSQEELDIILSGPIKTVQGIIATKNMESKSRYTGFDARSDAIANKVKVTEIHKENVFIDDTTKMKNNCIQSVVELTAKTTVKELFEIKSPVREVCTIKSPLREVFQIKSPVLFNSKPFEAEIIDLEAHSKLTFTQQYRSCSPDIFDDEISIMDDSKPVDVLSQGHKTKVFFDDNFMDLTRGANVLSQNTEAKIFINPSQNITKRKSNDFMEITECIVGFSQPICKELKEIDLTQSPNDKDAITEENHSNKSDIRSENNECLDLYSNDLETKLYSQNITDEQNLTVRINQTENTNTQQTPYNNIDLTQSSNEDDCRSKVAEVDEKESHNRHYGSMDLTQSSNSNDIDELPLVDIGNSQTEKSLDDTVITNEDEYLESNCKVKQSTTIENLSDRQIFDLTEDVKDASIEYNPSPTVNVNTIPCNISFFEELVHNNSENSKESGQDIDLYSQHKNSSPNSLSNNSNAIDLTQGSDTSEGSFISHKPITEFNNIPNNSSLGKKDNVSIDYDEILIDDKICEDSFREGENKNSQKLKCDPSKSEIHNNIVIVDAHNESDIDSSQNSEAFHISDKELDYSLHKSMLDIPRYNNDFEGISVLDIITKYGSLNKSVSEGINFTVAANKNDMMEYSFLPKVHIKKTDEKNIDTARNDTENSEVCSPMKVHVFKCNNGMKTPKNSEYIIKTDDVTPMADYASMSTPQRNRELDKYGLKPIKRKRAIQILTHIYNQTHPTIQQILDEDQPSPSKKPRQDTNIQISSPNKLLKSPRTSPSKGSRQNIKLTQASPKKHEALKEDRVNTCAQSSSRTAEEFKGVNDVCVYKVSNEAAVIRRIDCSPDDWVFQKREKAKVHSCRVPLHIAFDNYVSSRRSLREAILKYEPVNIDVIHKDLVGYGHRYDPKDILKYLDKKCITVKTTDNNSRNNKI